MIRLYFYTMLLPLLTAFLFKFGIRPVEPVVSAKATFSIASTIPICGSTQTGGIPQNLLNQPVTLRAKIGTFPFPTSTKSPKAQAFFEQGMVHLHGYQLVEALRHDSTMAMAYAGISRAYVQMEFQPYAAARKAAEQAKALANRVSDREREHIELRFAQLKALVSVSDLKALDEYRLRLKTAIKRFPNDAELWLLSGNSYEESALGRGQGSSPASIAIYEKVLQLAPNHPAAHHYLIHAYEGMTDYEKAIYHGAAYARLSPRLPHALHMYAHDLMKTGNVDEAIAQMKEADAIERDLYAADQYKAEYDWHHGHNIALLALCYQYQGRMKEAEELSRESYAMGFPTDTNFRYYRKKSLPELLFDQERYPEVLPIAQSLVKASTPAERLLGHYFLGLLQLHEGNLAGTRKSLKAAEAQLAMIRPAYPTTRLHGFVKHYPKFLAVLIRLQDKSTNEAGLQEIREFQKMARGQFGPDGWVEALYQLEMIADAALKGPDTNFAKEAVGVLAEHDPAYPGTHYLQAKLAKLNGDQKTASQQRELAIKGWSKADKEFTQRIF
ncbi:hypothetical protein GCM10023189_60610 [Nibrella saemangeumensis]|uniref:Tetratricopeptide repeat-containing protein n=1 Tax=Nibrella saemangeumensis TaxID=1084526 RepID=A0ABP8NSE4_9BACT